MHRYFQMVVFFVFSFFISLSLNAETEVTNKEAQKKELKTLILIIATDDKPAYRELQKIWEAYMNSDPEHFEAYFLRADPKLATKFQINKNEIILKTYEGFVPGILNKSIMALEALQPRLNEFDYVVRTNLSSFYSYPRLLNFLQTLPSKKCLCGVSMREVDKPYLKLGEIPFISGAGIILSSDLAQLLAKNHHKLEKYKTELPDDVFIGLFFHRYGIPHNYAKRYDYFTYQTWQNSKNNIPEDAFHFRAKYSYNLRTEEDPYKEEIATVTELLEKFYPER